MNGKKRKNKKLVLDSGKVNHFLRSDLAPNYLINKNSKKIKNYMGKFWKNAEITNGRLAMIGFLALIINYGFFGWIIPGFI